VAVSLLLLQLQTNSVIQKIEVMYSIFFKGLDEINIDWQYY
jgi:hypothetical protein